MSFDPIAVVRDYGDILAEAAACRAACAIFDYSFVARGRVEGPSALGALGRLTARRLDDLPEGRIRYAVRTDAAGHLTADLTVWRHPDGAFEVMSGRPSDIADLACLAAPGTVEDLSAEGAIFAVQGPRALAVLAAAGLDEQAIGWLGYYHFTVTAFEGSPLLVGRLGYTGEAGFELIVSRKDADVLWGRLAAHARPAGFAAADILRIEAGFVLFANEFRVPVTAAEAGLAGFHGAADAASPPEVALVAFTARAADRPVLWQPSAAVALPTRRGEIAITSACFSVAAGGVLGLGYVRYEDRAPGTPLVDPGGAFEGVQVAPRPFVDPDKRRPRAPWS